MKVSRVLTWACSGGIGITVSGCAQHHEPPPVYTEPQPQPGYVVVPQAPPPGVVEVRPYPPGPGYVWVDGYYSWTGGAYVWQRGYWAAPPPGYSIWISPRYERYGRGYRYVPGRWERREHEGDRR